MQGLLGQAHASACVVGMRPVGNGCVTAKRRAARQARHLPGVPNQARTVFRSPMEREPEQTPCRSVLYVEDSAVNAMLMRAIFERFPKLRLVVARNGSEAVRHVRGLFPTLLLIDLRLPDCHGTQLLPLLRMSAGCEAVIAVAVTADKDTDLTGTSFTELWPKPLNFDRVVQRLEALTTRGPRASAPTLGFAPTSTRWVSRF
jgi:CheY-like chemotaxis protein